MQSERYIQDLLIGTANPHLMPLSSIEMTAKQHMPLVPDQYSALQTYPAILWPCAKMILLSIPSHISQELIPLPIYLFVLRPESNEHAGLQKSQLQVKPPGTSRLTFAHSIR